MAKSKSVAKAVRYVVITTDHRGIFFGQLTSLDTATRAGVLTEARNCLKWSSEVRGFLGLAATGPIGSSRVGPAVPRLELTGITSVTDCTPAAAEQWMSGPWA